MPDQLVNMLAPVGFSALQIITILLVLRGSRREHTDGKAKPIEPVPEDYRKLSAQSLLTWEFEYVRITASEAMSVRQDVINHFLIATTLIGAGVLAVFTADPRDHVPMQLGTILFWLLPVLGWIYFLKLVRLRQAWHESASYMNHIKHYYIEHTADVPPSSFREAFLWQSHTLPAANKPLTVFHYSALLIAMVNSTAFVAGSLLLGYDGCSGSLIFEPSCLCYLHIGLGIVLFFFHMLMYRLFLKIKPEGSAKARVETDRAHSRACG